MRNSRRHLRKKKIIKKNLIVMLLILAIIFIGYIIVRTLAIYTSSVETEGSLNIGFWVVDAGYQENTILMENIIPSNEKYQYLFSISNNDGTKTADVDMEYVIKLKATTNLPLNYYLYKKVDNTNGINPSDLYTTGNNNYRRIPIVQSETPSLSSNYCTISQDANGTFYKESVYTFGYDNNKLIINYGARLTDNYLILVEFPLSYKTVAEYQDLVEYIKLSIEAKQIID